MMTSRSVADFMMFFISGLFSGVQQVVYSSGRVSGSLIQRIYHLPDEEEGICSSFPDCKDKWLVNFKYLWLGRHACQLYSYCGDCCGFGSFLINLHEGVLLHEADKYGGVCNS